MDWNKIATLLHIVDKSVGHPQLKNITNGALAELKKHNDGEYEQTPKQGTIEPLGRRRVIEPAPGDA